jgi:hypothetical protein
VIIMTPFLTTHSRARPRNELLLDISTVFKISILPIQLLLCRAIENTQIVEQKPSNPGTNDHYSRKFLFPAGVTK